MFYYNVTCQADKSIEAKWLKWMKEIHIPEVMQTGCFSKCRFLKLVSPIHSEHGDTYAVQYEYKTPEDFNRYIKEYADELRNKTLHEFGNSVQAFRTQLEILADF